MLMAIACFAFRSKMVSIFTFLLPNLHVPNQHYLEKYKEICKNVHYSGYFKTRQITHGNGFPYHFPSKIANSKFQIKREVCLDIRFVMINKTEGKLNAQVLIVTKSEVDFLWQKPFIFLVFQTQRDDKMDVASLLVLTPLLPLLKSKTKASLPVWIQFS